MSGMGLAADKELRRVTKASRKGIAARDCTAGHRNNLSLRVVNIQYQDLMTKKVYLEF
jgi:hypothetical protein